MPSQVEAILINTRSREIPCCSYNAINWRPLLIEPSRVEGETGVRLGRYPSWDNLQDLSTEQDKKMINGCLDLRGGVQGRIL